MPLDDYQLRATLVRYRARMAERQRNIYRIARGEVLSVDTPDRVRVFLQRRGIPVAEADRLMHERPRSSVAVAESFGVREPDALERIIGTNDLMGVAFLERGLAVSRTVARIWVSVSGGNPTGYGTGFLVSPRLLLTNNHVLSDAATARSSRAQFNYQLGSDGNVYPASLYGLDPDTCFFTDRELDYTAVAVMPTSDDRRELAEFGFNPLLEEQGKAIVAQWLNIIQHPSGGYKQLALRENHLVDIHDAFLTYQTDTAPGSSGSPVYNDQWEVVGLHHSGVMARDAQNRILAVDGQIWTPDMGENRIKWVANEGIRASAIIRDLREKAAATPQKQLIDDMLSLPSPPVLPRSQPQPPQLPRPNPGEALGPNLAEDGSASWTIPITINVRLPGHAAAPVGPLQMAPPAPPPPEPPDTLAVSDTARILTEAKALLGSRSDVLEVRQGYAFENGWITSKPAIVVKVRQRKPMAALREAGVAPLPSSIYGLPVEVVNPSIDDLVLAHRGQTPGELFGVGEPSAEEIVYQAPPHAELPQVSERMKLTACASPDHGWPVLKAFLQGVHRKLVVGMYDFGAVHIEKAIEALGEKAGFTRMTLAIQAGSDEGRGTKSEDLPDEEMVQQLAEALGDKFESAWVKIGIKNGWVAASYHIKVAVRDSAAFWLSSGNWQSSNQPDADPLHQDPPDRAWLTRYNREWHVVAENKKLAQAFEAYLANDFEQNRNLGEQESVAVPDILLPGAVLLEAPEERAAPFKYFDPFTADRKFDVRPLLTPDNFLPALLDVVRGAEHELLIQNQTFNAAKDSQTELGELLNAIIERQNAGVDVRIIFRVLDATKARENLEALQDRGFDMRRVKVQRNCHTKGVIADGSRVMIGSQNLSQLGITLNRDASLLFEDAELASYFAKIFEHDWSNLARQNIGSEAHAPELAATGQPTPQGMERLSWKEYIEMA